jgi:hypothetical protein
LRNFGPGDESADAGARFGDGAESGLRYDALVGEAPVAPPPYCGLRVLLEADGRSRGGSRELEAAMRDAPSRTDALAGRALSAREADASSCAGRWRSADAGREEGREEGRDEAGCVGGRALLAEAEDGEYPRLGGSAQGRCRSADAGLLLELGGRWRSAELGRELARDPEAEAEGGGTPGRALG